MIAAARILAERLVRVPIGLACVCLIALLLDDGSRAWAHLVARLSLRALLGAYLAAGLLNMPSFPRMLRGPATRIVVDAWLLDFWTLIAIFVAGVVVVEGSTRGLF